MHSTVAPALAAHWQPQQTTNSMANIEHESLRREPASQEEEEETEEEDEQEQQQQRQQQQLHQTLHTKYPPNHPLGNTKHLCSICGDRATGKHYGVYSCEGCKGFFKRTIRKDIVYVCRSTGDCLIDMRQRNRCQYCRYQKCLRQGMKREAVQEEKQRLKLRSSNQIQQELALTTTSFKISQNCDSQVESTVSNPMIGASQAQAHNQHNQHSLNLNNHLNNNSNQNQPVHALKSAYQHQAREDHLDSIHELSSSNLSALSSQDSSRDRPRSHDAPSTTTAAVQQTVGLADIQMSQTTYASYYSPIELEAHLNQTQYPQRSHYLSGSHHNQNLLHQHQHRPQNQSQALLARDDQPASQLDQHAVQNLNQLVPARFATPPPPFAPSRKRARIDSATLKWAAQVQIEQLIDWAKSVPKFNEILVDDRITLLKTNWNELIIAEIAFNSIEALRSEEEEGRCARNLCIGRGLYINESQAYEVSLSNTFDRIINELVVKMNNLRLDHNELACLKAIILFNPETQGLKSSQPIEKYRSDIFTALEAYCRKTHCNQFNRFGKLLLRLPALRSIGLKCDAMINNLSARPDAHQALNSELSVGSVASSTSSSFSSSCSSSSSSSSSPPANSNSNQAPIVSSSSVGHRSKLLFFDICYEPSTIDTFLKSSLQ